jgi:hypothetical protein
MIPTATAPDVLPVDNGANLAPETIYAANESRFSESFFSEPLTTYAVGWRDPANLEAALEYVAPSVQTSRRFEYKKMDNAEAFLSDTGIQDVRAPMADFARLEFKGYSALGQTENKGLTVVVDLDNVPPHGEWRTLYTARLMQRLLRSDLRRAIALLSAAATNTAKTWDTTAGKDPDMDVIAELITAANASGIKPNRVLYGDTAWQKRALAHRAQDTAGGFASASLTPDALASLLSVGNVRVSDERYQSSASAKSAIVNNLVLMYNAQSGTTTEDASNIKRFVSPTLTGQRFRVFEQQMTAKLVAITVEHYSKIVITSTLGIRQFTVS